MTEHNEQNGFDASDPLAQAWAEQNAGNRDALTLDTVELVASTARAHLKDQLKLLWLNMQELVPIVVVVALIGVPVTDAERPAAVYVGIALIVSVGAFLTISSTRHHLADRQWGGSIKDQLSRRLAQVSHRFRLYNNIAWWYLLPLATAMSLVRWGLGGDQVPVLEFSIGLTVLAAGIFFLNRWYARTRFQPEVVRLQAILDDFDQR